MQTADFDLNLFTTPRKGDEKLAIRFFVKAKQDGEASQKAGRPIFKEHEFIQIMVPGDRGHVVVRPVNNGDRARFSKQYEHWKATNSNDLANGTPLEKWGILNLAQVEEYKYFGIRTVEQMASIRDDLAAKIVGTQMLKQKAQQYMEIMAGEAPMKKVTAELEARDKTIGELTESLKEQAQLIKALQEQVNGKVFKTAK